MKELLKKLRGIDTGMLCIPALMLLGYIFIRAFVQMCESRLASW